MRVLLVVGVRWGIAEVGTTPPQALKALDVEQGDHVAFEVSGKTVTLHKVKWTIEKK